MIAARLSVLLAVVALSACGGSKAADKPAEKTPPPTAFGGPDRPVTLEVPDDYDAAKPYPLLLMIHGYMASGIAEESLLHLSEPARARGFLYAHPDGTFDKSGARYWNDWPGGHDNSTVDDVGYLGKLVADIRAAYNVDAKRIYFMGHSNGGAMSYRMACERSDIVAAVAILAGDMPVAVDSICKPNAEVHLLNTHGDMDSAVLYAGNASYLGAKACSEFWSKRGHCKSSGAGAPLDLTDGPGAETSVLRYSGCDPAGAVELWTIAGAGHIPLFGTKFGSGTTYAERMLDFLLAHGKP